MLTVPLWLDGKEVTTSKTFDVISPVSDRVIHKAAAASVEDVEATLRSSQQAFRKWSLSPPPVRRDIFLKAAQILIERKEECWSAVGDETGCDRQYFEFTFDLTVQACKDVAGLVQMICGTVRNMAENGRSAMVLREPYGVVLGVVPW